jgi:hypothetical protein
MKIAINKGIDLYIYIKIKKKINLIIKNRINIIKKKKY